MLLKLLNLCAVFFVLALPVAGQAAELIRLDSAGQITVRADRISNNDLEQTILAEGEVEIRRGANTLFADRVLVNTETMQADAMGNVRYTTPSEVLRGSRMLADLNTGLGKVYQARIYSFPTGFYLDGQEAERVGENLYRIKDGAITSCDDERPPWQFKASEINLEVEGYATIYNTTFEIMGVPALWSPWMIFPVKTNRQSGLLFPEFGYSDRDGFRWSQSYFQTLGDSQDMTLTANFMSRRGTDWGLEYRYSLTRDSKGMFMLNVLPEDQMGEDLYLDGSNTEAYNTRYWLRGKADQRLGPNTTVKLDLDIVSDRDFTDEFNFNQTGYHPTRTRLLEWFHRDIDSQYSLTRVNKLNLNHLLEDSSLNAGITYNDRLDNQDAVILHDLPKITWDMARSAIGNSPVFFQMDSAYNYNYRREGSKGHLLDMAPALAWPVNFNDYVMLEPRVTWKPHLYRLEQVQDDLADDSGFTNNINVTVDASSYLFNVYDLSSDNQEMMLKHALRPKVSYSYQSSLSGGGSLPDLLMRRDYKYHRISYGIDNSFTLKTSSWQIQDQDGQPDAGPEQSTDEQNQGSERMAFNWYGDDRLAFFSPVAAASLRQDVQQSQEYKYVEFMRFNLAHSFYIDPYVEDYTLEERKWGNFEGRLEITPFNDHILSMTVDTSWDVYCGDLDEISVLLSTRSQRGDFLSLDYSNRAYDIRSPIWERYDDYSGRTNQVSGTAHVNVGYGFSVTYNTRYDIERNRRFENTLALNYAAQCWGISFIFHEDEREQGYYIAFDLAGMNLFGR